MVKLLKARGAESLRTFPIKVRVLRVDDERAMSLSGARRQGNL